jgi:SAM-dependent methyltransferase
MSIALDLGCGARPRNTFNADTVYGIDINRVQAIPGFQVLQTDLVLERIPFQDDFVDYVTAFDFLEHVPRLLYVPHRRQPFIELMSEIWRVLKPGGVFFSSTPVYPNGAAFKDPTHVNVITPETFSEYFDDTKGWARDYGFKGAFHIERLVDHGPHLQATLRKP